MSQKPDFIEIRSFLLANVPIFLQMAGSYREAKKQEDMDDLFGDSEQSKELSIPWKYDFPLMPQFNLLLEEKNSLGLYVSGNPLEDFRPILDWVRQETFYDDIHLILVEKIRKIFTRAGGMMLVMQLTTPFESLEGLIFPKYALQFSAILEEKNLYWAFGSIKRKEKKEEVKEGEIKEYDEQPKLMLSQLAPFSEGPIGMIHKLDLALSSSREEKITKQDWQNLQANPKKFGNNDHPTLKTEDKTTADSSSLYLPKSLGTEKLKELRASLKNHYIPGGQQVEIYLEDKDTWKKVRGSFWIPQKEMEAFKKYLRPLY